jgi:hypothetical protein
MAHGLQVFTAGGDLRLDVSDRLTRLVHSDVVGATSSGSTTVAGITTANATVTAVAVDASAAYQCPHEVWITDNTVHWAAMPAPSSGNDVRVSSLILVFRYR